MPRARAPAASPRRQTLSLPASVGSTRTARRAGHHQPAAAQDRHALLGLNSSGQLGVGDTSRASTRRSCRTSAAPTCARWCAARARRSRSTPTAASSRGGRARTARSAPASAARCSSRGWSSGCCATRSTRWRAAAARARAHRQGAGGAGAATRTANSATATATSAGLPADGQSGGVPQQVRGLMGITVAAVACGRTRWSPSPPTARCTRGAAAAAWGTATRAAAARRRRSSLRPSRQRARGGVRLAAHARPARRRRALLVGLGRYGQLGHGDTQSQYSPKVVERLNRLSVMRLACGYRHTMVVVSPHAVWAWAGAATPARPREVGGHREPKPLNFAAADEVVSLCLGGRHSLALCADGGLRVGTRRGRWGWAPRERAACRRASPPSASFGGARASRRRSAEGPRASDGEV